MGGWTWLHYTRKILVAQYPPDEIPTRSAYGLFVASYFYAADVLRRTAFAFLIVTVLAGVIAFVTGWRASSAQLH